MPTITELQEAKKLWLKDNQCMLRQQPNYVRLQNMFKLVAAAANILRSGCKLMKADIHQTAKTPIVLFRRHRLTDLFVWETHPLNKHMSTKQTSWDIQNKYCILGGEATAGARSTSVSLANE